MGKFSRQQINNIFLTFSKKTVFDIPCKLTICMKYQTLFSGKNKKNILMSSAKKFTQHANCLKHQAKFVAEDILKKKKFRENKP